MKPLFVLVSLLLMLSSGLTGCAPASEQAIPCEKLSDLVSTLGFSFDVPLELPADFYLGQLLVPSHQNGMIRFFGGDREIVFAVSDKADALSKYTEQLTFTQSFHTENQEFTFYAPSQEDGQLGAALWEKGNAFYALSALTVYEAAGMIYSLTNAADLQDTSLWLPQEEYASAEELAANFEFPFTQPRIISDGYALSRFYQQGPQIAVAEYTGDKGTLLYRATQNKKFFDIRHFADEVTETETLFPGANQQLEISLLRPQDSDGFRLARWIYQDTLYTLETTNENTREQMLNLTREFCAWIESASQ
jgi:hypothetical protein